MTAASTATQITELQGDVKHLTERVTALTVTIEKLVEVDRALRLLINAIKWIAGIAAGIAAVWSTWRGH